ncbi:MAG: hypothetical protein V1820_05340 [archaeon]
MPSTQLNLSNVVLAYRSPETVVFVSPFDFAEGFFANLSVDERKDLIGALGETWGNFREAVRGKERSHPFNREPDEIFRKREWSSDAVSGEAKPSSGLIRKPPGAYKVGAKGLFKPEEGYTQMDCGCPKSVIAGIRDEAAVSSSSCAHSAGFLVAFYRHQLGKDGAPEFRQVHGKDDGRVPFVPFIFTPMQAGQAIVNHYLGGETQMGINLELLNGLGEKYTHAAVREAMRKHRLRIEGLKASQEGMDTAEYEEIRRQQKELEGEGFVRQGIWVAPDGVTAGWNYLNPKNGFVTRFFYDEREGPLCLAGSYSRGTFKLPKFDPKFKLEVDDQGEMTDTWNGMLLTYEITPLKRAER